MARGCSRCLEGESWILERGSGWKLRDARLGDRFLKLLTDIRSAMGQSIPLICQDWANTKEPYRFFSNNRASEADILAGHFQSTCDRAAAAEGLIFCAARHNRVQLSTREVRTIGITESSGQDQARRLRWHTVCGIPMHSKNGRALRQAHRSRACTGAMSLSERQACSIVGADRKVIRYGPAALRTRSCAAGCAISPTSGCGSATAGRSSC
ncbi:hypothetical protein GGD65_006328 [Bradyrhizobium sp. CIR18]|nr:hypothetical protein [Bradyrhizobium sp. CIR18]